MSDLPPPANSISSAGKAIAAGLVGLLSLAALRFATCHTGDAMVALRLEGLRRLGAAFTWSLLTLSLLVLIVVLIRRIGWRSRIAFLLGFACAATLGYREVGVEQRAPFGAVLAGPPSSEWLETVPNRPRVRYRTNERGFRGPSFGDEKLAGTRRVVLVGDSFVFGSGVEWPDTLGVALEAELRARAPGARWEVLDLGIAGDNLVSHVSVVEEAIARLHPDDVVLCLTLPNDLSADDDQQLAQASLRRFSAYNFARWWLGPHAATYLYIPPQVATVSGASVAVLDAQIARLKAMLDRSSGPSLTVFTYHDLHELHPEIYSAFGRIPHARVVPPVPDEPAYYLPRDGHPTAAGNRVFAERIAAVLAR